MKKVSKDYKILIIKLLEMCCSLCHFENHHKTHRLIQLSDIESLSKENITLESVTNDFNQISQMVIDLKNKIENEINKINELYD